MDNTSHNGLVRKRGRPAGKSRKPLNNEQKRARNALYERERRVEIAEATSDLAEAVGVDQSISVAALLNTVLKVIRKSSQDPPQSIHVLRNRNKNLSKEIEDLERFLSKNKKKDTKKSVRGSGDNTDKQETREINRKNENHREQPSTSANQQKQEDQDILFNSEFIIPTEFDLNIELSDIWATWLN